MKLVIQIPCFNEAEMLPVTLAALPRRVAGFDEVEWLVVDDGSTDATSAVASEFGVDHLVRLPRHQGLARAFVAGLDRALEAGADVVVNTDADNQYCADDIPVLVAPILAGTAELVVGARPVAQRRDFSLLKRWLQRLGSWATRVVSNTAVADAPSGFRAMSRAAAMRIHVFNEYTYTIETIIQAGQKGIPIASVPIRTNEELRPSRLVKSVRSYVFRSMLTMLRVFMTYQPLRFFLAVGSVPFSLGVLVGIRWIVLYFGGTPRSHVPSLVLGAILLIMGFQLWILGLVADLLAVNRKILEESQLRLRRAELDRSHQPEESLV